MLRFHRNKRNLEIRKLHAAGVRQKDIAAEIGLTPPRVAQILQRWERFDANRKQDGFRVSVRLYNCLVRRGVNFALGAEPVMQQIGQLTIHDLASTKNLGKESIGELLVVYRRRMLAGGDSERHE